MLRALLNAIGLGRATAPTVEAAIEPAKSRGGRPRSHHLDRAATAAERKQAFLARKKTRNERNETQFRSGNETLPLKEEEKKERSGSPISKDWRPDLEGMRLGKEAYGDRFEAELADHIDYCLKTDFRCHDHDANWRRRCRAVIRDPQLKLNLRARARQLGVKDCEPKGASDWQARRREQRRTVQDVARELAEEYRARPGYEESMRDVTPAPTSDEDKAKVKASLERFRRGGTKEASG